MAATDDDANAAYAAAYVAAAARLLALPIAVEHLSGVHENFERLAAMARLVVDAPLDLRDEPAPVFTPGAKA